MVSPDYTADYPAAEKLPTLEKRIAAVRKKALHNAILPIILLLAAIVIILLPPVSFSRAFIPLSCSLIAFSGHVHPHFSYMISWKRIISAYANLPADEFLIKLQKLDDAKLLRLYISILDDGATKYRHEIREELTKRGLAEGDKGPVFLLHADWPATFPPEKKAYADMTDNYICFRYLFGEVIIPFDRITKVVAMRTAYNDKGIPKKALVITYYWWKHRRGIFMENIDEWMKYFKKKNIWFSDRSEGLDVLLPGNKGTLYISWYNMLLDTLLGKIRGK